MFFVFLWSFARTEFGLVLAVGGALLIAGAIGPEWPLVKRAMRAVFPHRWAYGMLYLWLIGAYAGFHLVIPAASFFKNRMVLTLLIPTILLITMLLLLLAEMLSKRYRVVIAGAVAVLFVLASDQGVPSAKSASEMQIRDLETVIEYLRTVLHS